MDARARVAHGGAVGDDERVARRRGPQTVGDMVRSLGLVVGAVAVVLLLTLRPHGQEVRVVDYRAALAAARPSAPFALVAPVGLADGWRATSAYYDPAGAGRTGVSTWHVGFVTPQEQYAGFEQTNRGAADVLRQVLQQPGDEGRTATVAGRTWERWSDDRSSHRALVVGTGSSVMLVVDGSAGWPELERLAAALRPAR